MIERAFAYACRPSLLTQKRGLHIALVTLKVIVFKNVCNSEDHTLCSLVRIFDTFSYVVFTFCSYCGDERVHNSWYKHRSYYYMVHICPCIPMPGLTGDLYSSPSPLELEQ